MFDKTLDRTKPSSLVYNNEIITKKSIFCMSSLVKFSKYLNYKYLNL